MGEGRLLPWPGPEGKPARVLGSGWLSDLADEVEESQLAMSERMLNIADAMLADEKVSAAEVRFLARQLAMVLIDVVRVARSRGERLPLDDAQDPVTEGS